ncbi:MAG: topoisomerase C-terminal repeat-containing protein [Flavobacteriaceae bacterium]|nr:topoisomerase C-terminal repeat-containing protein [Flavobacteriaceae bacterium]
MVKCPDESCNWLQFRNVCGILISISDIENLIINGRTSLIKGLKSKAGNKFNAFILLNDKAESSFEIVNNKPKRK